MMFFLVLFCFGPVFGDGNVTAPTGGQNVTGPAQNQIVTTMAPQINLVSLFTQFITEAKVNDAKHTKEIKHIHNLVTEKFLAITKRLANINSAVSKNMGSIKTTKLDVTTIKSDITKLKKDAQYCVTGYKSTFGSKDWEKVTIKMTFPKAFKETPYISLSVPASYVDVSGMYWAPGFYAEVSDATSSGFNVGLWMDVKNKTNYKWKVLVYYIACGKI